MKVVMFSQTTCGPCRQLKPHLLAAANRQQLELEVWEVDKNWPLCQEYNVTYTPTCFVMDEDNKVVKRLVSTDPRRPLAEGEQLFFALDIEAELKPYGNV
jgi:thiol-disulfide isomerase/thioredoxin